MNINKQASMLIEQLTFIKDEYIRTQEELKAENA